MLQGLIPNISWQTWEQQSIRRKRCGWISHGRRVICGLQRLCCLLWQTACANSQESTHFQHKTVGFIMVVKILPLALLVGLCQVCCDVSASTGKKLWERRGKTPQQWFFTCVSSQNSNLILFLSWPRWFYILQGKTGMPWPLGWAMHETRLVIFLQGLWHWRFWMSISPPWISQYITWLVVLLLQLILKFFCFSPQLGERFLSNVSGKRKEKCVFFPYAAPSPKHLPLQTEAICI